MKHILKLNNGQAVLLNSILSIPEQFNDSGSWLRAAFLIEKLDITIPKDANDLNQWAEATFSDSFELTESQRDLCKKSIEKNISKIPPTKSAISLLSQFGFSE